MTDDAIHLSISTPATHFRLHASAVIFSKDSKKCVKKSPTTREQGLSNRPVAVRQQYGSLTTYTTTDSYDGPRSADRSLKTGPKTEADRTEDQRPEAASGLGPKTRDHWSCDRAKTKDQWSWPPPRPKIEDLGRGARISDSRASRASRRPRCIPSNSSHPEPSRAIPSHPEPSRAIPSHLEPSRAISSHLEPSQMRSSTLQRAPSLMIVYV